MLINENDKKNKEYAEIYQVAHMYYDLNKLQSEIADQLYLSRPKVSRLLAQARELGIVEIKVNPIIDRLPSIEKKMCELFGLKDAVVISTQPDKMEQMEEILIKFAASYTSTQLNKGGVLGITDGNTVNEILNKISISDEYPLDIVQLMGAAVNSLSMQDTTLILTRLSKNHPNINLNLLSIPLYVNDLYLKEVLMQEPAVHAVMSKMSQCTVALTGLSALDKKIHHHNSWYSQMSPHHIEELKDRKAVGCICAQYFDINGIKVTSEWNAKTLAMNINNFARIETRIGVAQGLDKIRVILGALRGRLLNVLITDSNTAYDLIQIAEKKKK